MPSDSDAAQAKKPRKKPRPPQQIDPAIWAMIEKVVCAGMSFSAAAREYHVSVFAIMQRARRNKWPVGSRIQRRVEALQEARYKAQERYKSYEQARNANEMVTEAIAESWAERGERHRNISFDLASSALRKAARKGLPVRTWRDASLADSVARKASGLDHDTSSVTLGLQLVEYRLQSISLPKDALPSGDGLDEPQYGPPRVKPIQNPLSTDVEPNGLEGSP